MVGRVSRYAWEQGWYGWQHRNYLEENAKKTVQMWLEEGKDIVMEACKVIRDWHIETGRKIVESERDESNGRLNRYLECYLEFMDVFPERPSLDDCLCLIGEQIWGLLEWAYWSRIRVNGVETALGLLASEVRFKYNDVRQGDISPLVGLCKEYGSRSERCKKM